MNTPQLEIIEHVIDDSEMLDNLDKLIENVVSSAKQQIHFDAKALSKVSDVDKKVYEAHKRLDEMDEAKLEYWLKTVMFNRLQNRIDSLFNQNIEEQMERL